MITPLAGVQSYVGSSLSGCEAFSAGKVAISSSNGSSVKRRVTQARVPFSARHLAYSYATKASWVQLCEARI